MIIERKEYLEKLIAWKDKQLIKIVTGVRRCGKSMLLEIYRNYLKEHGIEEEQIISINFEDLDYEELTDYRKLYKYLKERLIDGKMTYIFLDEIQNVTDFPKVLDSLYIKKNIDIYVTGSNAYMLSSEIATMISGRYIQIEMLPLSFKEYMESTGSMNDRGIKYAEYLQNSSFPFTLELKNQPDEIRDYLEGIYNTIVVKDIINRKKITTMFLVSSVQNILDILIHGAVVLMLVLSQQVTVIRHLLPLQRFQQQTENIMYNLINQRAYPKATSQQLTITITIV